MKPTISSSEPGAKLNSFIRSVLGKSKVENKKFEKPVFL